MSKYLIAQEIIDERERQIANGWTLDHDMSHGKDHLLRLALTRLPHWVGNIGEEPEYSVPNRRELVEAAALIVAALEVNDRPTVPVHTHGTEEGRGLACKERVLPSGKRRGECITWDDDPA